MTARGAVRAAPGTEPSRRRNGVGETESLMVHQREQAGALRLPFFFSFSDPEKPLGFRILFFFLWCFDIPNIVVHLLIEFQKFPKRFFSRAENGANVRDPTGNFRLIAFAVSDSGIDRFR